MQNELVANRRSAGDKDRQVMSDEKSNDHWPSDNRECHSIEELRLDNFQVDQLSERSNENRFDEHDRQEEEERQTERQIRIVQLKIILQQQMNELKQKEEEVCFSHLIISHVISISVAIIQTRRRSSSQGKTLLRTIPRREETNEQTLCSTGHEVQ